MENLETKKVFRTDPVVILTSGATIDGREIKPETVVEVAESYNPGVYNAIINIEHDQNSTKLGSVLELSTRDHGDKKQLLAVLKPNDYFLYMIERGQKIHTSCEIIGNFAKTGKPYLVGLAVTDSPASLGTSALHLSKEGAEVEVFSTQEVIEKKKPKFLETLLNQQPNEEELMDKAAMEVLSQVAETQKTLTTSVNGIHQSLSALIEGNQGNTGKDNTGKTGGDGDAPEGEKTDLAKMQEQITELSGALEESNKTIETLTENLSQFTDEQPRSQADGGSEDDGELTPKNIL